MQVTGLFHVAIKTNDLDATVKFYTDVLGIKLVHRPDFGSPGAWIAAGDSVPIVHIYAGGPALVDGKTPYGTGSLDHVSLTIKGWGECLERVRRVGDDWRAASIRPTRRLVRRSRRRLKPPRVPGAMQHAAKRSAALQTRDPGFFLIGG